MQDKPEPFSIADLSEKELTDMLIGVDHRVESTSKLQWKNNWTYGAWVIALLFIVIASGIVPINYSPAWAIGNSVLWIVNSMVFAYTKYRRAIIDIDSAYFTIGMEFDRRNIIE